jgi:hypothetical protein
MAGKIGAAMIRARTAALAAAALGADGPGPVDAPTDVALSGTSTGVPSGGSGTVLGVVDGFVVEVVLDVPVVDVVVVVGFVVVVVVGRGGV